MDKSRLVDIKNNAVDINSRLPTLLLVDDVEVNLQFLIGYFKKGYNLPVARNGESAWALIQSWPDLIDAVLLDRMMPDIMGDEVLKRIKNEKDLKHIPVIFQSAKTSDSDIDEGLALGADYYFTKPYNRQQVTATVNAAVKQYRFFKNLSKNLHNTQQILNTLSHIKEGIFTFRTIQEAGQMSLLLSNIHPEPIKILYGLIELNTNAVEHGIAQISYEEKSELNSKGTWNQEVERRLDLQENQEKKATIKVEVIFDKSGQKTIRFQIQDPGDGFDHKKYRTISEDRLFDSHGRGVVISVSSFDELIYNEKGNMVTAVIKC